MLIIFWRWQKRIKLLVWLNNHRIREIEEKLDFTIWKNWRVHGLDLYYGKEKNKQKKKKWDEKLTPALKEMIDRLRKCYPQKARKDEIC